MKLLVKKGKTSKRVFISIQDSSSTTGAGLTGLTSGSGSLVCYRARDDDGNAAGTQLALTGGTKGTWSSGGFVEKDSTNMPGIYELGLDNAGLASGSDQVIYILKGATNMAPVRLEIQLTDFDPQDGVHLGLSSLPNTACTGNASLLTSGTGTDQLSVSSGRVDLGKALGTAITLDSNSVLNVSTKYLAGTLLTGRDIGTSVLVSSGTGTGQLSVTSGIVDANVRSYTSGQAPIIPVRTNTAQGGNASSIALDASASATTNFYKGLLCIITSGTGLGQARIITNYNGSTKSATVDWPWITAPDNTSVFSLYGSGDPATNSTLQVTASNARVTVRSGTAQTGSTTNTIKLDATASATDNLYTGNLTNLTGGTGAGQSRTIISYNGTTKVATVDRNWVTTPDNTTTFDIIATTDATFSDQGLLQAAGSTTAQLASTSSSVNNFYNLGTITILSGTGSGQTREITAYVGSTHTATVGSAWSVTPDSTSSYAVIPSSDNASVPSNGSIVNANAVQWLGANIVAPATAGVPDTNVKNYNNQTALTDANNLPKIDVEDIRGTLSVGVAGYVGPDWSHVNAPTSSNTLSGTTIGTLTTYTGNTVQTGDAFARLGAPAGASIAADLAEIAAETDLISGPPTIRKNTALAAFEFVLYDSTDHVSPKTGRTVTAQRSIDGAALSSCTNSVTEVSNGIYKINLSAADLNGNTITLRFSASGADDALITIVTQP